MPNTTKAPERKAAQPVTSARAAEPHAGFLQEDRFVGRHLGPRARDVAEMLATLGYDSLDALIDAIVPDDIRLRRQLALPAALTEREALAELRSLASRNQVFRSYLGMGYYD